MGILIRRTNLRLLFLAVAFFTAGIFYGQCPTVADTSQTFCDLQSPTVANLQATDGGGGVAWFLSPTGGTALSPGTGLNNGTTYYADNAAGNCGVRTAVSVTVYGAPGGLPFQGVCVGVAANATISDLIATGNNVQWYSVPAGGTPLAPGTVLNDNTIYYASQTNPDTGCETSRLSVFVNVGVVPVPTGPAVQQFCNDPNGPVPTVADLTATGANNWYSTSSSAVILPLDTPLIDGESYYATTVDPPCESIDRLEVIVDLVEPNNAGSNGVRDICVNQTATTAPFNLFTLLGGTPDSTGTWSGPVGTTNGHLGTLDPSGLTLAGSPYVFTYTVTGICQPATSTVTITILPLPVATIAANQTICFGQQATITFTGTPNATVTYNVDGGANQSIVLNASGTATVTGTYTATTVFNLVSVASAGTPSCSQPVSGSATINVLPLPVATISSNQTICSGQQATVTFTGTPNSVVTYSINGGANQLIILNASGTASVTNTYTANATFTLISVVSSGTPSCTRSLTGSVVITVVPIPVVTISSNATVCPGGQATVTFTGTANAQATYTVNGGPSQSITLNAAGTATITQNYTATTTYTLTGISTTGVPSCPAPASGSVTITVLPPPTATIAANTTICSGQTATVTFTGTPNATVSYTVNGGAVQTIVLNASGTAAISQAFTATTTYSLMSVASAGTPSCVQPLSQQIVVTVLPLPVVSISSNQTICAGQQATVNFTGTPNATVNFTVNGLTQTIVLNASGTAGFTSTFDATTVISLVSASTATTPACTNPQSGSVTITVIPPPTASISSSQTICSGQQATITFTGTPGAIVTYSVNGGPGQNITLNAAGTASITQVYTATTTYTLTSISVSGTPSCPAPVSGSVTITIAPLPVVSISSSQTVCSGQPATVTFTGTPGAVVNYTVNGSAQTITLDASGQAQITQNYTANTTFVLVSAATSGTPSCSAPQTGTVTITVLPLPTVSILQNQTICPGETATVVFTGTPGAIVAYTVNGQPQSITLNASGTASVTQTFTETTVFSLQTITTGGTPSCTAPASGTVTITIPPPPTIVVTGPQGLCPGQPGTITFTGTPGAVVTYTVNGGAVQTIVLDASGSASISQNFSAETTYTIVQVTSPGTPACTVPGNSSHTVTVLPLPTASLSGEATVCSGQPATVNFTGTPGAVVSYTVNGTAQQVTLDASGNASVVLTLSQTSTVILTNVSNGGCEQTLSQSIQITVLPLPVASLSASQTICSGSSANLSVTGTPGAVVSYTINGGPAQTVTLDAAGNGVIAGTFTADTTVVLTSVVLSGTPACSQNLNVTANITVIPLPEATISATSTTVCSGTNATIAITGTPNATVSYTINGGAVQSVTLNASGTATISPLVNQATTVALTFITTNGTPSCGQALSASVTVTATAAPQAGNDVANFEVCQTAGPVNLFTLLGPDAQAGGFWTPALAGGIFNPQTNASGTYFYTVPGNAPCPDDVASVTVNVILPANAGADADLSVCSNEDPVNLFELLGPTAQPGGTWSPALSGGNVLNPAVDASGVYTYTVTGNAACGTDSAVVNVTVTPGPNAGEDGTMTICVNSSPENLFDFLNGTPQVGGTWSPALASGTGVFNPAVDAPGVYTYTFAGNQPCDNDTATVTVTVNPVPNAGSDGNAFFCTNNAPQDLINFLTGAQAGGTWSPALSSGTGVFNPAVDAAGVYTYTVGGNLCSLDTATVTVTIGQSPNAGGPGAALDVCVTETALDLFTGLNGSQGAGTWNDDNASGALSGSVFNPSAAGVGTYTFTYTVGGGTSPCLTDSATVTVVVSPQPNAGTFNQVQSVCTSSGTFDLNTLLDGEQSGGQWTDAAGTAVANPLDVSSLLAGTFTYTYTITNGCGTDSEQVQLTILPVPVLAIPNITLVTPICLGANATVTLTGVPDGTYELAFDLSGANVSSQSVSVVVSGGTGSFNIPASSLTNTGTTTISFTLITNISTQCSSALAGVQVNVVTNPPATISGSNLSATAVCLGSTVTVDISGATSLNDGSYQFAYVIPGGTPSTGTTNVVTIAGGSGQFTVPASVFTVAADYQLTINQIIALSGGCTNLSADASVAITILPSPDITGAQLSVGDICLASDATVQITGAVALADGDYTLTYSLSGAVVSSASVQITLVAGAATFVIPANALLEGNITLTIDQLVSSGGQCGASGTGFGSATFAVSQPGTPQLIEGGNEFCGDDSPVIADLSANIAGGQPVVWYDSPAGTTPIDPQTPLVNGQTYYASTVAGDCESAVRLEVTVDTTVCELDILIPDGFSPNGDSINDTFVIVNIRQVYPNFKLEIYNRYGNILYKGNAATPDWDGTASQGGVKLGDGEVPVGVYFYILEFNDGNRSPKQGRLYLSR